MSTLITGIRKTATVKKGGKIEITSSELPPGTKVDVLVLVKWVSTLAGTVERQTKFVAPACCPALNG
jgi:hypothetical protein